MTGAGTGAGTVLGGTSIDCAIADGNASGQCSATFDAGASVTLSATPAAEDLFEGWSQGCSGTADQCTLTVAQATTVVATFMAAQPSINLNPDSVGFTATEGGSSPGAQSVAVTNTGTGTLSGLAVGTISYGAGATGWLAASVSPTTAPATVTLTPTLGTLGAGTYTATVPVTSSATGVTNSPQTITVTFEVAMPAPSAPTNLSATPASAAQVDLSWTDNSTNEADFEVQRCAGAGCTDFALVGTAPADTTDYQDTGLSPSTVYLYRVRAVNSGGSSSWTTTASALTMPAAPTSTSASPASMGYVLLKWSTGSPADSFRVDICTGPNCTSFNPLVTVPATQDSLLASGFTVGALYSFRVSAWNASGYSQPSSSVGTVLLAPNADATALSTSPATNFGTADTLIAMNALNAASAYSLVAFTIPSLSRVTAARLYLYGVTMQGTQTLQIIRVAGSWTETGLTWNNGPTGTSPPSPLYVPVAAASWNSADVTSFVSGWLQGTYTNYGFQLYPSSTGSGLVFYSREHTGRRPLLTITF